MRENHSDKSLDYYSVVDSLSALLAPTGTVGVVDFYGKSLDKNIELTKC